MQSLHKYIERLTGISEASWKILTACMAEMECKRGEKLLKEGEVCRAVFYISKGFCKSVYNSEGREVNTAFYFEGDFAANTKSLINGEASAYSIIACEKMKVLRIDKGQLLEAYKKSHEIESFGRKLLEIIVTRQEEHADSFKMFTPRQRYENLLNQKPEFFQRVSLTQAASFLGISRETLSRIRGG